ncbi:MAG: cobalamin-dependent protein, partial [Pseudomonadota bacterium]
AEVERKLANLKHVAESGAGNLLEASCDAMRARATVGEVSEVLAHCFGRHQATGSGVSGVFSAMFSDDPAFQALRARIDAFALREGRRPRILIAKMGQDGHDRGARVIASGFADLGFDVDIGPLFQTPVETARQAIENDVHVIGVSSQAAGHTTLVPQLITALHEQEGDDIRVVCGGVIPEDDYPMLRSCGVAAIFGPGTSIQHCAEQVVDILGA